MPVSVSDSPLASVVLELVRSPLLIVARREVDVVDFPFALVDDLDGCLAREGRGGERGRE